LHEVVIVIVIVIVTSDCLEHQPKAKRARCPYSRTLRQVKWFFQRAVHGELRSDFQRVRENRAGVKVGVV